MASTFDIAPYTSLNLKTIREAIEPSVSIAVFAEEAGVSHQTLRSWESGSAVPPVDRILTLRENLCRLHPSHPLRNFSLDQFYSTVMAVDKEQYYEVAEDHKNILGNYFMYAYDTAHTDLSPEASLARPLRYIVLSVLPRYDADGILASRPAVYAAPFKEKEKALAFYAKLKSFEALQDLREQYRSSDMLFHDTFLGENLKNLYLGEVHLLKDDYFAITLENEPNLDHVTLYLVRPNNRESVYIGGLGLMASISRGSRSCPTAQEVIVARGIIERSDERIAGYLDVDFEIPDLENELSDAVVSYREMRDKLTGAGLKDEDTDGILVHRIMKLYKKALSELAFSHFRLDAANEEYQNIYHMLRNHIRSEI